MRTWHQARQWAAMLGAAVLVAACGGGGSGGVDTGGTGAPLSFSKGPISGFGSVIVNAVRFDDSDATIVDADGNRLRRDDLKLGMVAEIDGDGIVAGSAGATSTAKASRIRISSEIVGPVEGIDVARQTLTVLGQEVRVNSATAFDTALPSQLASLENDDVVEVYALPDGVSGRYLATRIGLKTSATRYRLRGVVASLITSARTFAIGNLTVSYAGLSSDPVPLGLANGRIVTLQLAMTPVSGVWTALRIDDASATPDDRSHARIEGLVTAVTSARVFTVDGVSVNASSAELPDGAVALGLRVEVEGALVGGVLVANKVEIEDESESAEVELIGSVSAVNTNANTFVLRGFNVVYGNDVRFDDGREVNLIDNAQVEVRGTLAPDRISVIATRIKFEQP